MEQNNELSTIIKLEKVSFSYKDKEILKGLDLEIEKGKITTILGSNGSGKSTLFYLMTKALKSYRGNIYLEGKNIKDIGLKEFSKKVSLIQQTNNVIEGISIEELVFLGRTPYKKLLASNTDLDIKITEWAMKVTDIYDLKDRDISKLSGGQRQRAWIAMALAQDTEILFLDEPTTFLDIRYQIEILELIKKLNREHGKTIVMVLHDINQAIHYSDNIIGLKDGNIVMQGRANVAIDEDRVEKIYGLKLKIADVHGKKYVLTS